MKGEGARFIFFRLSLEVEEIENDEPGHARTVVEETALPLARPPAPRSSLDSPRRERGCSFGHPRTL